jgi:TRAP-type mannitol/chloroaromatic compound transport system permease small subunit
MVMRTLNQCDRLLGLAILFFNGVAAVWVLLMMLAVVSDVLCRFLFNAPIAGTTEIVTMSVVAVLYLQLSYTLRSGGMTRSDALITRLIVRRPRIAHPLNIIFFLAGAGLMGAIMSVAWPKWIDAYSNDFYVGVVGVFTFPDWPRLFIVFVGCGLTGLQFLMLAAKDAQKLLNPGSRA